MSSSVVSTCDPVKDLETITPSMVPLYLRDSEFGASLNYDDDEDFSGPIGVTQHTTKVDSLESLSHLLNTIRFWGVRNLPSEVFEFAFANDPAEVILTCDKYSTELLQVGIIAEALRVETRVEQMEIAMKSGYLVLVKYLHSKGIHFTEQAVQLAIHNGHAECLEYALQRDIGLSDVACTAAIHSTDTACIRVVLKCCPDSTNRTPVDIYPHPYERYTVLDAAACIGDIDCIENARKRGIDWVGSATTAAASNGQLNCLKYLHERGCRWGFHTLHAAAKKKPFDCVAYALEHGAQIYYMEILDDIVKAGELECLRLLDEDFFRSRISRPCFLAAQHGHLHCLVYLREHHHCQLDSTVTITAAENGHYECLWYAVQKHLCPTLVAQGGEQLLLQFAQHTTPVHALQLAVCAATNGYISCLTYAVQQGCRRYTMVCNAAAANGKLDCLQYLCEQGFRYSGHTMQIAARSGHYVCVAYLLEQGCAVDVPTCDRLAAGGQLHLLKLALSRLCSSSSNISTKSMSLSSKDCARILEAAARHGQLACLQYLHEQLGFPVMDKVVSAAAVRKGQWECVRYLAQQGCGVAKKALKRQAGPATA